MQAGALLRYIRKVGEMSATTFAQRGLHHGAAGVSDWRSSLPPAPDEWLAALLAMPHAEAAPLARAIVGAWVDGSLELEHVPGLRDVEQLRALRHMLAALAATLGSAGFDLDIVTGNPGIDETSARRWCWIEPWALIEQDEDLFLMDEKFYIPLLEEVGARCPKGDYAMSIVEHGIRDHTHAVLRKDPQALREHLAATSRWIPIARRARAPELAAYCERLAGYADVARVDEEGARDRGRDLSSCSPTPHPFVARRDDVWLVDISRREPRTEALAVEVGTGKMRLEKWPKAQGH